MTQIDPKDRPLGRIDKMMARDLDHLEHEMEPIPGLPERPPEGEEILWQGKPQWSGLALRVFHIRKVAVYFAILLTWVGVTAVHDGGTPLQAAWAMTEVLPFPIAGLVLLAVLAKLYARTTIFTITNKRVLMRFGIALSLTVNYPFSKVVGASLRQCGDGTGDLAVEVTSGKDRIAYLHLWPFAKPGQYRTPMPMLRSVADPAQVADLLAAALADELAEGEVHKVDAPGAKILAEDDGFTTDNAVTA